MLLPTFGGYWFLTHFNRSKFYALRASGYHLFFRSAIFGLLLFAFSHLLVASLGPSWVLDQLAALGPDSRLFALAQESANSWELLVGQRSPELHANATARPGGQSAILALFLGLLLPVLLNGVFSEVNAAAREAERRGDLVELLLENAMTHNVEARQRRKARVRGWLATLRRAPRRLRSTRRLLVRLSRVGQVNRAQTVAVSLASGKTYVGFPIQSGLLAHEDSDIKLLVYASGSRDRSTGRLDINTYYHHLHERLRPPGSRRSPGQSAASNRVGATLRSFLRGMTRRKPRSGTDQEALRELIITIPITEVVSARLFSLPLYKDEVVRREGPPPRRIV